MNMPFIADVTALESVGGRDLWSYFHRGMQAMPSNAPLRTLMRSTDEYMWYVSMVLSRRAGGAMLVPLLDVLNHCVGPVACPTSSSAAQSALTMKDAVLPPLSSSSSFNNSPNAYYTMATESTFCGIDVLDNIMAGVDLPLLYHPYLHCFTVARIRKGEEILLSYSDAAPATPDGRDIWRLLWGFQPLRRTGVSETDLKAMAGVIAERRVDMRSEFFPMPKAKNIQSSSSTAGAGESGEFQVV